MTHHPAHTPTKAPRPEEEQAQETGLAPIQHGHATRSKDVKPTAEKTEKTHASAAPKPKEEKAEGVVPAHATRSHVAAAATAAAPMKEEPTAPPTHKKAKTTDEEAGCAADVPAGPHNLAIDRPLHAALETSPTPGSTKAPTILESGRIVFLYDPTKGAAGAGVASLKDVRHFLVALVPSVDSDEKARAAGVEDWHAQARLLIVGKKKLPCSVGERYWGFVDAVADAYDALFKRKQGAAEGGNKLKAALGEGTPAAADAALRVVAEGTYALTRVGNAPGTGHLTYVLSEPAGHVEAGSAQGEFGIEDSSRLVLSIKNPLSVRGQGMGLAVKAKFPPEAQAAFAGKTSRTAATGLAWVNASAHDKLLSTERAEVLLIKAKQAEERDRALTHSLAEAGAEDHAERVEAMHAEAKGAGGPAAEEFDATLAALNEELHARQLGLDVAPAVTRQLE